MRYIIIAVCAAIIILSFVYVAAVIKKQLSGKCCGDCKSCHAGCRKCDKQ